MKEKKPGKIAAIVVITAVVAFIIFDLLQLRRSFVKYKNELGAKANKRAKKKKESKQEMIEDTLKLNMERFEKAMEAHGAVARTDLDEENVEKFELRTIYEYNGNYYRVEKVQFEEEDVPYIVINAIDSERFAKIGVMEEIEAYPYDMPEERIEEVVAEVLESEL